MRSQAMTHLYTCWWTELWKCQDFRLCSSLVTPVWSMDPQHWYIQDLVRNADSQAPPQTYCIRIDIIAICMHIKVWTAWVKTCSELISYQYSANKFCPVCPGKKLNEASLYENSLNAIEMQRWEQWALVVRERGRGIFITQLQYLCWSESLCIFDLVL